MSAWAELVNRDSSNEWLDLCSRALEEVQRETSRRNAEKIRNSERLRSYTDDHMGDCYEAADEIDPEVE